MKINAEMIKRLNWAKRDVEKNYIKNYSGDVEGRKWISGMAEFEEYNVSVWILSGSPVKGHIIVNYGTDNIKAFGPHDEKIRLKNWENN